MVGQIMVPKDVYLPGTCEYITFQGTRNLQVIKLRMLRWKGDPGLLEQAQCITIVMAHVRGRQRMRTTGR